MTWLRNQLVLKIPEIVKKFEAVPCEIIKNISYSHRGIVRVQIFINWGGFGQGLKLNNQFLHPFFQNRSFRISWIYLTVEKFLHQKCFNISTWLKLKLCIWFIICTILNKYMFLSTSFDHFWSTAFCTFDPLPGHQETSWISWPIAFW